MMDKHRQGWPYLLGRSASVNRDERRVALIRGYAWVEHALTADGFSKSSGRSIAERLIRAKADGILGARLTEEQLRSAIRHRHAAAHEDSIPSPQECHEAVSTLSKAWKDLRSSFVNTLNSAKLCDLLLSVKGVTSILLFGSLARGQSEPGDIDLLVLDDGTFSVPLHTYAGDRYISTVALTKKVLRMLNLLDTHLKQAVSCRWLDILLVNGSRFGNDIHYTSNLSKRQVDPYFFLNIAMDAKDYIPASRQFTTTTQPALASLRVIGQDLTRRGFTGK